MIIKSTAGLVLWTVLFCSASTTSTAQTGDFLSSQRIEVSNPTFGTSAAALGDLDGDGVGDVAVGSPLSDKVTILFLNADGTLRASQEVYASVGGFVGMPGFSDGEFGASLAYMGDLDGDGRPELAVGAPEADSFHGAVWILSLNSDGTVYDELLIGEGRGGYSGQLPVSGKFGYAMARVGDVDGNGVADLAVGLPTAQKFRRWGSVKILFLQADGTVIGFQGINQNADTALKGQLDDGAELGRAVTAVGDLDGNGVPDLAVGAPGQTPRGAVMLLYLEASGKAIDFDQIDSGSTGIDFSLGFGTAVESVGDLDGDGVGDLAVGTPCETITIGSQSGTLHRNEVWFLFLAADRSVKGSQRTPVAQLSASVCNEGAFGLSNLGDLDGDGKPELVVGDPGTNSVHVVDVDNSGFAPPVASIGLELVLGLGTTVRFVDRSTNNVSSWMWDLGNGVTSTLPEPTMSFPVGTQQTIQLTVTGFAGSSSTQTTLRLDPATSQDFNGSGVNPDCLTTVYPPRIGQPWLAVVDASAYPTATAGLLLVYGAPSSGTFLKGGELLVDLSSPRLLSLALPVPSFGPRHVNFQTTVPNDLSIVGLTSALQGGLIDATGLVLCDGATQMAGY
ncbi:MAG TPA: hypothetical protein ENJ09_00570 [Planctomycetes bacterium]|nr:hypothetical protein [Planctomycetota bacterium]